MGSSSAIFKTLTTCSLGSQLSAGTNHQLKIAKMVMAPRMTPAYVMNQKEIPVRLDMVTEKQLVGLGGTHEIERLSSDGKEER